MAKKPIFVSSPDSFDETRLTDVDTHKHDDTHTQPHTDTHEHEHTHTHKHEPVAREKKSRRIQILTFDSLVERMDAYAKKRGVSRAEVFEVALEKFLSDLGE